jgi:hypothetical protein
LKGGTIKNNTLHRNVLRVQQSHPCYTTTQDPSQENSGEVSVVRDSMNMALSEKMISCASSSTSKFSFLSKCLVTKQRSLMKTGSASQYLETQN